MAFKMLLILFWESPTSQVTFIYIALFTIQIVSKILGKMSKARV